MAIVWACRSSVEAYASAGKKVVVPRPRCPACQAWMVFWSGYQLEERYWHLYWIPAYTSRGVVGLDVTEVAPPTKKRKKPASRVVEVAPATRRRMRRSRRRKNCRARLLP